MAGKERALAGGRGERIESLRLQACFDDELPAAEAAELRARLADNDDDRRRFEALEEMRELVRFEHEQHLESVELSSLWARIEPRLDAASAPVELVHQTPAPEPPRDWLATRWASFLAFLQLHRRALVPSFAAALIAALFVAPMAMNQAPSEHVLDDERMIVIVEPLRFEGGSTGAVSYTPQSNTPVIWYLGAQSVTPPGDSLAPSVPSEVEPRLRLKLEKLFQRLERLERWAWPNTPSPDGTPAPGLVEPAPEKGLRPEEILPYIDALREATGLRRGGSNGPL